MCRALVYLGQPVLIDHLLYQPDSALVKQSFMPRMLRMLNLAGFGMMAWDRNSQSPDKPYLYSSTELPVFDRNLKALAEKVKASCMLAHVRGVGYSTEATISNQNTHPFRFPEFKLAMAHNGDLYRFEEMKHSLLKFLKPEIAKLICGTTDSEWIYALLLSQLEEPRESQPAENIKEAVEKALRIVQQVRRQHEISVSSSVNLFITDGENLTAIRYCFDFGRYALGGPESVHEADLSFLSLWYTSGREFGFHEGEWKMIGGSDTADSLIVASEPLTLDTTSWLEVPEYSMIYASTRSGRPVVDTYYLDV